MPRMPIKTERFHPTAGGLLLLRLSQAAMKFTSLPFLTRRASGRFLLKEELRLAGDATTERFFMFGRTAELW